MNNLTVGIFGDRDFAKEMGKKGTANDIELYNHGSSNSMFTYATPNSEKIQSLLQVLNMIDLPVLIINEINQEIGELMIAIDQIGFKTGYILFDSSMTKEQIEPLIKDTSLVQFKIMEKDTTILRTELENQNPQKKQTDSVLITIDNYFQVKSVGAVILGIVKEGTVKKYDKLMLEPLGKEILIKSIQSKDTDIKEADERTRVGLCIKGADIEELRRGQIICTKDLVKKTRTLEIEYQLSRFNKTRLEEGKQIFICCGLTVSTGKITELKDTTLKIETEWDICYNPKLNYLNKVILAGTTQKLPRIIGKGIILNT